MSRKTSVSHDEWMIAELRRDPKFAAEYLKQSMADMGDPEGRGIDAAGAAASCGSARGNGRSCDGSRDTARKPLSRTIAER